MYKSLPWQVSKVKTIWYKKA